MMASDWTEQRRVSPLAPRPTNVLRTVFHAGSAGVAITAIVTLPSRRWLVAIPAAFAVYAWSMEAARRVSPRLNDRLMRFYGAVAHPQERHHVNSATWFGTALVVLALFATRPAMMAGCAILGVADPVAGIVGRRWGRRRLGNGRSLEGALAFFVVGSIAAAIALGAGGAMAGGAGGDAGLAPLFVVACACGLAGALTELFSTRLDDNLTIPLVVGALATSAAPLLG